MYTIIVYDVSCIIYDSIGFGVYHATALVSYSPTVVLDYNTLELPIPGYGFYA